MEFQFSVDDLTQPCYLLMRKNNPSITDYSVFIFEEEKFDGKSVENIVKHICKKKKRHITFSILQPSLVDKLKLLFNESGYESHHSSCYDLVSSTVFYSEGVQDKPEALPDGFLFCDLKESVAETINDKWDYKDADSLELLRHLIRDNVNVGIKDETEDKLVCWVMLHDYNAIGVLQTDDAYRRKGLARACVVELIRRLRIAVDPISEAASYTPFAYIFEDNVSSKNLFDSLGFKPIKNRLLWMQLELRGTRKRKSTTAH
jgi:GNAT superfamily N-acetyltransferase